MLFQLLVFIGVFACSTNRLPQTQLTPEQARKLKPKTTATGCKIAVQQVVQLKAGDIESCYHARLVTRPKMKGRLALMVNISPNGHVQNTYLTNNTTNDKILGVCVEKLARKWKFPEGCSGKTNLSFVLNPTKTARKKTKP